MSHKISTHDSIQNLVTNIGEEFHLPEWFMAECRTLMSQDRVFSPFASLGLVGRVAIVTIPESERKVLLRKIGKNMLPGKRVASWWKNHRDVVGMSLEHEALERVVKLMKLTFDIWKPEDSERSVEDLALTWVRKRDNLESILFMIGKNPERRLDRAIEESDRLAKKYLKHRLALARPHPRFLSVLEAEPASWWAAYPALRGERKMTG